MLARPFTVLLRWTFRLRLLWPLGGGLERSGVAFVHRDSRTRHAAATGGGKELIATRLGSPRPLVFCHPRAVQPKTGGLGRGGDRSCRCTKWSF